MTFDPQVAALLDAAAPPSWASERPDWRDVLRRSGHPSALGHHRRAPHRLLALAVVAAALLALAGTAVGLGLDLLGQQERFHAEAPDGPQRIGPLVEIASGEEWALIAWRSKEAGICLDLAIPGNSPFACDFPVRGAKPPTDTSGSGAPTHSVAGFVVSGNLVGGDGKTTIFGVAAHDVATVKVHVRDGRVLDARLHDAPPSLRARVRFFIVRTHAEPGKLGSPVRAYEAYADDGALIERFAD